HDLASQMEAVMEAQRSGKVERKKINTRNILFVVSGAFAGLPDIIQRRMNQKALGFQSDPQITRNTETENWLRYTKSEDLMEFGFESEFIGRLPVLAILNTLDEDALFRIVTNPKSSVVRSKKRDFLAYGIEIDFTEDALAFLAKQAFGEKTGARGLTTVFERALLKYEKKLPSTNIQKLTITREMVENPEAELKKVLMSVAVKTFQREFLERTGIVITFTPEARELARD
ncbi:AAA family ATPase, partial [bacterium]|nr:AAA family ATPase [bacterium]